MAIEDRIAEIIKKEKLPFEFVEGKFYHTGSNFEKDIEKLEIAFTIDEDNYEVLYELDNIGRGLPEFFPEWQKIVDQQNEVYQDLIEKGVVKDGWLTKKGWEVISPSETTTKLYADTEASWNFPIISKVYNYFQQRKARKELEAKLKEAGMEYVDTNFQKRHIREILLSLAGIMVLAGLSGCTSDNGHHSNNNHSSTSEFVPAVTEINVEYVYNTYSSFSIKLFDAFHEITDVDYKIISHDHIISSKHLDPHSKQYPSAAGNNSYTGKISLDLEQDAKKYDFENNSYVLEFIIKNSIGAKNTIKINEDILPYIGNIKNFVWRGDNNNPISSHIIIHENNEGNWTYLDYHLSLDINYDISNNGAPIEFSQTGLSGHYYINDGKETDNVKIDIKATVTGDSDSYSDRGNIEFKFPVNSLKYTYLE